MPLVAELLRKDAQPSTPVLPAGGTGQVDAIVGALNIVDAVGDYVSYGAYRGTLEGANPDPVRVCWGHD